MDSEILDQLTDLGRDVDSEFPKPKRGHQPKVINQRLKKADTKINEMEDNGHKRQERETSCVRSIW